MAMDRLFKKPPSLGYSDLVTSETVGWTSLELRLTETSANGDEFESSPTKAVGVHIVLEEESGREAFLNGVWRQLEVSPGKVATTLPGEIWRLRYNDRRRINKNLMIHLQLPLASLQSASEQLPIRTKSVITAIADDKVLAPFAASLLLALRAGASNLYAEASAVWLSTQLLLNDESNSLWIAALNKERVPDARLVQVLEYIQEHLKDDLSLKTLARESGLSQFTFATLFQRTMGKSPHKHVLHLRMANAASLLRETKTAVADVALLCGFRTVPHFCVAFRKSFGQSPTEYRVRHKLSHICAGG